MAVIVTVMNAPTVGACSRTYEDEGDDYDDKHDYSCDHLVTPRD